MTPDLILHIGQSKTGTSSIQRCMGSRRQAMLEEGVFYPQSPGHANHGLLPASLVPVDALGHFNPDLWDGVSPEARLQRFRREFAAELGALPDGVRTVVISAEQCSGLLQDEAAIGRLRDLVSPYVSTIRVVIYLRRQDQHWASGYTQALRVAVLRPPVLPEEGPDRLHAYDYATLLDRWACVFGEDAMAPRVFERDAMLNGDVVDDFFSLCGLQQRVPADDEERQSNQAITADAIVFVRRFGEHMARVDGEQPQASSLLWRRFMQAVSEVAPGKGWRPGPEEATAFMKRFEAVNEAVRRRWFPARERLFSAAFPPGDATADRAAELDGALEVACTTLAREIEEGRLREGQASLRLGRLQEKAGDLDAAAKSFAASVRIAPELAAAHFQRAQLLLQLGDLNGAAAQLDRFRRLHPTDPNVERLERKLRGAGGQVR